MVRVERRGSRAEQEEAVALERAKLREREEEEQEEAQEEAVGEAEAGRDEELHDVHWLR